MPNAGPAPFIADGDVEASQKEQQEYHPVCRVGMLADKIENIIHKIYFFI